MARLHLAVPHSPWSWINAEFARVLAVAYWHVNEAGWKLPGACHYSATIYQKGKAIQLVRAGCLVAHAYGMASD